MTLSKNITGNKNASNGPLKQTSTVAMMYTEGPGLVKHYDVLTSVPPRPFDEVFAAFYFNDLYQGTAKKVL